MILYFTASPSPLVITGWQTPVMEGDTVKLVCQSSGGRPQTALRWTKAGTTNTNVSISCIVHFKRLASQHIHKEIKLQKAMNGMDRILSKTDKFLSGDTHINATTSAM